VFLFKGKTMVKKCQECSDSAREYAESKGIKDLTDDEQHTLSVYLHIKKGVC
jgi:hypothetical protein